MNKHVIFFKVYAGLTCCGAKVRLQLQRTKDTFSTNFPVSTPKTQVSQKVPCFLFPSKPLRFPAVAKLFKTELC